MVWDTRNAPLRRITPDLDQKTYDQVKAEHLPLCRITPGFDVYCEKAGKDTFTVVPFSAAFICTARPSFIGNEKTPFTYLPPSWTCPLCGRTGNTAKFCPKCGCARP